MKQPQVPAAAAPSSRPPQRLLVPCARCTLTVLRGLYERGGQLRKFTTPREPVSGDLHDCDVALARWFGVLRLRWQALWIFGGYTQEGGSGAPQAAATAEERPSTRQQHPEV